MITRLLYKRKKKKYGVHFGCEDIVFNNIVLNPVHILPQIQWEYGQEVDFYMDDGIDIYFLRVKNTSDYKITLLNDKGLRYLIVSVPIDNMYELEKIIGLLNKFPYNQKMYTKEKVFEFGEKLYGKGVEINRKR